MAESAYTRLIQLLEDQGASYRLIEHEPEGATDAVSALRGHELGQAAKCLVVMVKIGKKVKRYALVVVAGDKRVDLQAVKKLYDGTYVGFADQEIAEELSGSVTGTILPFSFDERLELIVDHGLLEEPEFFFNAGRLDRSVALSGKDYRRITQARAESVATA
ncbi:YbaK/EbsC family protein [Streptomyces sp. NPDC048416]|uniref:YbaK/EbsC family protein n=1 Tax=Streptomyces sp. NPDC048416 TaxID=3365546 RepID=UPI00370FB73A